MWIYALACSPSVPSGECCPSSTGSDPAPVEPTPGEFWTPAPETTWQWQLTEDIDTSFDVSVYDVDLFETPQATIDALHADNRVVICYFSAGSYEDFRDDAAQYPEAAIGEPLDGWPGEWWIDTRSTAVRDLLEARLDVAVEKACDAVEPDNVDGWANETGFPLTRADQLDFNRFLAAEAHARGLSVGLKNAVELVPDLVDAFDWSLDEECLQYDECTALHPFLDQQKAVFHVEYVNRPGQGAALAEDVDQDVGSRPVGPLLPVIR